MSKMSGLLKRQMAVMILLPLIFGGAAFLFTRMMIIPEYGSTATAVVRGASSKDKDLSYEDVLAAQTLAKMTVNVAKSREIADAVTEEINDPAILSEHLLESVEIAVIPDSNIVSVEYFDADPYRSAEVANQYISVLEDRVPEYYKGTLLTPLDRAVAAQLPGRPSAAFNTLAAVLAGLAAAMLIAYLLANYTNYN